MIRNKCLVCGSFNLRADRALSGRLVCNSCGTPYGVGKSRINKNNYMNISKRNNKYVFFICLLVIAFVLVIV